MSRRMTGTVILPTPEQSDAARCRANGWAVGTMLEGDDGYPPGKVEP